MASIGALAVFQANPDIVWVGTGEGNPRNSVSVGNGVYRSLDGGKTWTPPRPREAPSASTASCSIPTNPDVAWVAALGQAWGENPERGVYKTEDGGKSWKRVLYVDEQTGAADLAIDPRNPEQALRRRCGSYRRWPWFFHSGGPGSGLHVTYDGGETWKQLTPRRTACPPATSAGSASRISRSNPDVVYAMVEAKKSALLRSDDGGRTWKTVNDRYDVNPRPFYFGDIRVDPQLPNRVYSLDFDVRVSDDGGKTFTTLIDGGVIHGDFHALWIDPARTREHLVVGDDGGLGDQPRPRQDRALRPQPAARPVLPCGRRHGAAVQRLRRPAGQRLLARPQRRLAGGRHPQPLWLSVGGGDGFETLPDLGDARYIYSDVAGRQPRPLRTCDRRGPRASSRARRRGQAPSCASTGTPASPPTRSTPARSTCGSQFLHKSTDRGETWTTISPDLTTTTRNGRSRTRAAA